MSNKIEQMETRSQDSELEESWQLSGYFMGTVHSWPQTFAFWTKQWAIVSLVLPDFKPERTRHESVNYGISKYLST